MKKVFIVCGKTSKENLHFWITAIYSSKKKAERSVKMLDEENPGIYHYYFEEPVI